MDNNDKLVVDIVRKSEIIAKSLRKGVDVEIRRSPTGITVAEIKKTVVAK